MMSFCKINQRYKAKSLDHEIHVGPSDLEIVRGHWQCQTEQVYKV